MELTREQKDEAFKRICLVSLERVRHAIDGSSYTDLYKWDWNNEDERDYILHALGEIHYNDGKFKGFLYGLVVGDFVREKLSDDSELDKELKIYA